MPQISSTAQTARTAPSHVAQLRHSAQLGAGADASHRTASMESAS